MVDIKLFPFQLSALQGPSACEPWASALGNRNNRSITLSHFSLLTSHFSLLTSHFSQPRPVLSSCCLRPTVCSPRIAPYGSYSLPPSFHPRRADRPGGAGDWADGSRCRKSKQRLWTTRPCLRRHHPTSPESRTETHGDHDPRCRSRC